MIHVETLDNVCTLTIDRPEKANSLTREMLCAIADAAESAATAGLSAFVLTGRGKVFSAGADLDEARAGLATDPVWERLSGAIAALPCLTIAALNGTLAGGAMESVRFLLEHCARWGRPLKAGTLVSTGAVTGVHRVHAGDEAVCIFKDIAELHCSVVRAEAQ